MLPRCLDLPMPEQALQVAEIGAAEEVINRECVPQRVRPDAGGPAMPADRFTEAARAEGIPRALPIKASPIPRRLVSLHPCAVRACYSCLTKGVAQTLLIPLDVVACVLLH